MNIFYRFLRCAALMVLMMTWTMPAGAQHPFVLTTQAQHEAHSGETLYWIESNGAAGFYMIPMNNSNDAGVSTSNMPNEKMLWYFMNAGIENSTQYYYIVNKSTGRYLRLKGANGADGSIGINVFASDDSYKFSISGSEGHWVFSPKSGSTYYVNKKGGNANYTNGLKSSTANDANSKWNFVAENDVTWAHPFTNSTSGDQHYYLIQNRHTDYTSFYLSTDASDYVTVSTVNNNYRIWYFVEASSDDTIPNFKYYYIINAVTDNYMYFNSNTLTGGNSLSDAFEIQAYPGGDEDRYQFAIVNAKGDTYSAYSIMPKKLIGLYQNRYTSLGTTTMEDGQRVGTLQDRGLNDNTAHWVFEEKTGVLVEAPTITDDNGTITLSTTTEGATIYYTTNGDTPNNTSTEYTSPFSLGDATVIMAIAYVDSEHSDVSVYNVHDYSQDYLTFNVLSNGTICWKAFGSTYKTIQYSKNNGEWTEITSTDDGDTIPVATDDVVRFKGSNLTYATSKNNYSGFEGGTATFNIEGNIQSLLYGDSFADNNSLTNSTYQFCSLFKKSLVISAENLILPATILKNYCYRALFSLCTTLEKAPELPATTLAQGCYWYMFEKCAITSAPELYAMTLVNECYGNMFNGCSSLSYIMCLATTGLNSNNCLTNWVNGVSSTGTFVKEENTTWSLGASGIPSSWTIQTETILYSPEISCNGEYITISCETPDASIFYRLNQTGSFLLYTSPILVNSNTTVEAYSSKNNNTSNTVIISFEIFSNPFDESNRSINSWTYGGTQVTLPYSVNCIDGHSSSYAKGTHTFETTITLYKLQPTYLWFQHADQSADIYVDNTFVTTHWGGYNAFFVDITDHVHIGTNRIKVILNNTTRNALAPCAGDFNFNATLGKAKLFTSPIMPSMDYGYDGFHITSTVTDASATINIKTSIPEGSTVICKIDADDEYYHFADTLASTGSEMTFTTTIPNPHLWNGIEDPFLYDVTLEIYDTLHNELYHRFQRPYGFRYYDYVINQPGYVDGENYTGFILNGQPYLLRGVCTHHDLEGKANALDDDDIANDFDIIKELGCNFLRLAHYPHPKEVYDWCDSLGIIVQTEVPCVNRLQSTLPEDYYTHLTTQYEDMVNQHYNHPCIVFWGLSNETTTDDKDFAKEKIEEYASLIKGLDSERLVGYVMSHSIDNPSGYYNDPDVDWFGCNIYSGWYIDQNSNDPSSRLTTRLSKTLARLGKPLAFSEYGCGGTQSCHSDDFMTTTTRGNNPRHDIEYQMWLHEGHIAAIKNFPELLFTSQWQLFDIAVSNRQEGYKVCLDGETVTDNYNLKYLNNKGLVERDHKTKKDPFYLYKAWWNQTDKFVHICGKDYDKLTGRVIKCYTNDGDSLTLYVNNEKIKTTTVTDNIATFTETDFRPGDVIRVDGATSNDTFTFSDVYVFKTDGNWDEASNWRGHAISAVGCDVIIKAECTIPEGTVARANDITIDGNGSLTIADGGQLILPNNTSVQATVQKSTVASIETKDYVSKWNAISSPVDNVAISSFVEGTHNVYRYDEESVVWQEYRNTGNIFENLENGRGYIYRSSENGIEFYGDVITGDTDGIVTCPHLSYACNNGKYLGFNLIGNPFTHNITWENLTTTTNISDAGFFLLGVDGEWTAQTTSETIAPMQAFMIQATEANPVVKVSNSLGVSKGNDDRYDIDQIKLTVNDSEYSDVTYAVFKEGYGLNKIEHHNADIPRLYIINNNQDFAIATMPDNTNVINIGFNATKMGQYTLSIKAEGNYSCMHLYDKLTDSDIDMLLDESYKFIGSSSDRKDRFVLRLNHNAADIDTESDVFAYQNGNSIIVSGEGELQIFDITGRSVMATTINGVKSINVANRGVYIMKLNEKTQKIVIK